MITWRNYQAWDNPGPFPHCFAQCSAMILIWIRPLGTSSAYKVMNRASRQNWTLTFFHCFRMPFTSFYYSTARVLHALTSPVRFITILSALHSTFAAVTHDTPRTSPTWKRLLVCDQPSDCLKARCAMCTTSSWKRSLSFAPNHGVYFNSKWNRREKSHESWTISDTSSWSLQHSNLLWQVPHLQRQDPASQPGNGPPSASGHPKTENSAWAA